MVYVINSIMLSKYTSMLSVKNGTFIFFNMRILVKDWKGAVIMSMTSFVPNMRGTNFQYFFIKYNCLLVFCRYFFLRLWRLPSIPRGLFKKNREWILSNPFSSMKMIIQFFSFIITFIFECQTCLAFLEF